MYPYLSSIQSFAQAYAESDFFGKLIFIGLYALSILCWIILLNKMYFLRKIQKQSRVYLEIAKQRNIVHFDESQYILPISTPFYSVYRCLKDKTVEILKKNHYFLSQLKANEKDVPAYLSNSDIELIENHAYFNASLELKKLEKNLFLLPTIVTLAPFLGLLGTVWGILVSFTGMRTGSMAASNSVVLGGISTALATTVLGLVIAIPALVGYSYIRNILKSLTSDCQVFIHQSISNVELQYRKADVE